MAPKATMIGIRVQDLAQMKWYSAYPEREQAYCTPGSKKMHFVFGARNDGDVDGNLYGRLQDNLGNTLIDYTFQWCAVGNFVYWEKDLDMPASDYTLYASVGDYGYETVTVLVKPLGGAPSGKITAIRVQDLATGKWYSWDNGVWDTMPVCTVGENKLYVAFYAINSGAGGNLTLEIIETDTGKVLARKTAYAEYNAGVGIESTTDAVDPAFKTKNLPMPGSSYKLNLKVTP